MRIGIFFGDNGTAAEIVSAAASVERDGFESFWMPQIFGPDALIGLALAGRETSAIELGTSVVPVYGRHPVALAQQALTVQSACDGRLALGIGLSHQPVVESMWGLSYERPAVHMREYLAVLLPLLREGRATFSGDVFRVNAMAQVKDATPPKVLIAALAPVMLRLAAEQTDGTVTWMCGVKTIETHIAPRINAAAEKAGRPAPRVCVALPIAVTDDAAAARERVGQTFAMYGTLVNYQRVLAKEGNAGPADVAIVGTENEVEAQLRALAAAGATDFVAAILPVGDKPDESYARTRALLKGLVGKV